MFVEDEPASLATPPAKPEGAEWAAPVKVIEKYPYRADGPGYLDVGFEFGCGHQRHRQMVASDSRALIVWFSSWMLQPRPLT